MRHMVVSCGADTIFCFDRGCRRFKELTLREHWIVLYATATSSSSISPQYAFSAPLWWPHRPRLAPPTTLLKYGPFPFRILYKRNIYRGRGVQATGWWCLRLDFLPLAAELFRSPPLKSGTLYRNTSSQPLRFSPSGVT